MSRTAGAFTLDLNRTQEALESELGPADFSLRFLGIVPHDARLARLTPAALQRNGIEPVGPAEWLDAGTRRPLMLVYIDRPARIAGSFTRGGETVRYDIRAVKSGYVWIGAGAGGRARHALHGGSAAATSGLDDHRQKVEWVCTPLAW